MAESEQGAHPEPIRPDTVRHGGARPSAPPCYGALDLGTNNCRLLIATPTGAPASDSGGFRVVEAFSRIVRLGEGLSRTGRLDEGAMDRAVAALAICADKLRRRRTLKLAAVATQACRAASNGEAFIARVHAETGLALRVIAPQEEARLSVQGCAALLDRAAGAALVIDVGGGSTELSWLDLDARRDGAPKVAAWLSVPIGVVTLAERFPETIPATTAWFRAMVEHVKAEISAFGAADPLRPRFAEGRAHLVGTSGAITSLAGLHLNLKRYERGRVDGLWMTHGDCQAAAERLLALDRMGRAQEPCIGPDRADLVLAGAAILQAVQELWPCERVRVADRGLREGLLMSLMESRAKGGGRSRRRRRGGRGPGSPSQAPA